MPRTSRAWCTGMSSRPMCSSTIAGIAISPTSDSAVPHRTPDAPASVDDVLIRGLAKDPTQRQQSCAELVDEVRRALGIHPPAGRRRRRRSVAIGVAVALAAAAVLVMLAPWRAEQVSAVP